MSRKRGFSPLKWGSQKTKVREGTEKIALQNNTIIIGKEEIGVSSRENERSRRTLEGKMIDGLEKKKGSFEGRRGLQDRLQDSRGVRFESK